MFFHPWRRFITRLQTSWKRVGVKKKLLISPPWSRRHKMVDELPHKKIAFLSGWGMDNGAKYSYNVDEVFPLSDHADFKELLEYVKESNPEKIYVVHGFKE